jgi:hypothetical protein
METRNFGIMLVALLLVSPAGYALNTNAAGTVGVIKLYSGWNMVSVPANAKVSMADVASTCGTAAYAWRMGQSGYVKEDTLVPGYGYWVKGTKDCLFPVVPQTKQLFVQPGLFSGWNLVGAASNAMQISSNAGDCQITSGPWHYSPSISNYEYSDSLKPGEAYWIRVSSSCTLGSEQPPVPPDNQAPVITSVSAPSSLKVGEAGTWSVSAYDPEGKQLTYSAFWGDEPSKSGAAQAASATQSSSFTHVYYSAGTYYQKFTVTDDKGANTQTSSVVVVSSQPVPAPAAQKITIPQSGNYEINVAWYDTAGSSVIAVEKPLYKSLGTFSGENNWVNSVAQLGYLNAGDEVVLSIQTLWNGQWYNKVNSTDPYYISVAQNGNQFRIEADDGIKYDGGYNDALIYLQPSSQNQPPVISTIGGPTSLTAGQTGTWSVSAYDPEGSQLSYYVTWGDEAADLARRSVSAVQTSSFTHVYYSPGTYTATFTVMDSSGASATSSYVVQVTSKEYISVTVPSAGETLTTGNSYTISWSTSPGLRNYLGCVEAVYLATGGTYNIDCGSTLLSSGQAVWNVPTWAPAGEYKVRVSVYASTGQPVGESGAISVVNPISAINKAPVISSLSAPSQLRIGEAGTWSVSAYDPEGKQLTYSFVWGDENPYMGRPMVASQAASATHAYYTAGTYTVFVTATDDKGATAQATATVSVLPKTDCVVMPICIAGHVAAFSHYGSDGCAVYVCKAVGQVQTTANPTVVR